MRSPLPDSLHIFNAISGTPTAATVQGLPNSSSVVWAWPLPCPRDLWPLQPRHTHVITGVEEIYMFPPHPGDFSDCFLWRLNQKLCILLLAILPVLLVTAVKKSGRMAQTIKLQWLFTYYKYFRPLLMCVLSCSFWMISSSSDVESWTRAWSGVVFTWCFCRSGRGTACDTLDTHTC